MYDLITSLTCPFAGFPRKERYIRDELSQCVAKELVKTFTLFAYRNSRNSYTMHFMQPAVIHRAAPVQIISRRLKHRQRDSTQVQVTKTTTTKYRIFV